MRNSKVQFIVHAAMIAAIYVVLTYFISAFNLASGAIQVRISEALTILPYFTPAAIPGLFVGCLLANLLTGAAIYDVIFGSLATLLGAVGTYLLRKHKFLCTLAPATSTRLKCKEEKNCSTKWVAHAATAHLGKLAMTTTGHRKG